MPFILKNHQNERQCRLLFDQPTMMKYCLPIECIVLFVKSPFWNFKSVKCFSTLSRCPLEHRVSNSASTLEAVMTMCQSRGLAACLARFPCSPANRIDHPATAPYKPCSQARPRGEKLCSLNERSRALLGVTRRAIFFPDSFCDLRKTRAGRFATRGLAFRAVT